MPCFNNSHKGGVRKSHTKLSLSMCIQCEFQISTKRCEQCEDDFCDSCCKHSHRAGRLRIHTFKWLVVKCENCQELRAKWDFCNPDENYRPVPLCNACLEIRISRISYNCSEFITLRKHSGAIVDEYRSEKTKQADLLISFQKVSQT